MSVLDAWLSLALSYVRVDQGILRVDLLEGKDIHAADRGGLYYVFYFILKIRSLT